MSSKKRKIKRKKSHHLLAKKDIFSNVGRNDESIVSVVMFIRKTAITSITDYLLYHWVGTSDRELSAPIFSYVFPADQ